MNCLYFSVSFDPAGQFANPYSYGGDPVNYVDPNGEFATFGFHSGGFSLGVNLTPIQVPVGAGINVGWENGGYVGFYGEVGPRVGCSGATAETGYNYYFHHGSQVYTSVGFQNGPWRAGVSNSYDFQSEQWSGVTLNASVAIPGTNFGVGGSYNLKTRDLNGSIAYYGSNGNWDYHAGIGFGDNGFSWNLGGQYVNRTIHPSGFTQEGINDALSKQLSESPDSRQEYILKDGDTKAVAGVLYQTVDVKGNLIQIVERVATPKGYYPEERIMHTHNIYLIINGMIRGELIPTHGDLYGQFKDNLDRQHFMLHAETKKIYQYSVRTDVSIPSGADLRRYVNLREFAVNPTNFQRAYYALFY